jgi:pimeloyl-ACP methyl ester carboxylesterase
MRDPEYIVDAGEGLPLVLIHAFPLNADMWEPQRAGLSGEFRIVAYDLPGFARGGAAEVAPSMDGCADAFAAMLDRLGIDRCVVGGCSMGGYIAMAVARRHPQRLAGLVLADTRAGADTPEGRDGRLAQAAAVRATGPSVVIDAMLPKLLSAESRVSQPDLEAKVRSIMEQASTEGIAGMLEAMAARPASDDMLAALHLPACIIVGEHDALTPPKEAEQMARLMPGAELHVLAGAGHLANLEAPDEFNDAVSGFLRSLR